MFERTVQQDTTSIRQNGYDIFQVDITQFDFKPLSPEPFGDPKGIPVGILLTYVPEVRDLDPDKRALDVLRTWVRQKDTMVVPRSEQENIGAWFPFQCIGGPCSSDAVCNSVWNDTLQDSLIPDDSLQGDPYGPTIGDISVSWQCQFLVYPSNFSLQRTSCHTPQFALNRSLWDGEKIDEHQLPTLWRGGVDRGYHSDSYTEFPALFWTGALQDETFSEAVGRQLLNQPGFRCSLETPCRSSLECLNIGSWTAIAMGTQKVCLSLPWALHVISSLVNINQQLLNQYSELKDALESLALDTFSIDTYFPKKGQDVDVLNGLAGLSGLFSILGGFVPFAGPAIAAAGTIASAVSYPLGWASVLIQRSTVGWHILSELCIEQRSPETSENVCR